MIDVDTHIIVGVSNLSVERDWFFTKELHVIGCQPQP